MALSWMLSLLDLDRPGRGRHLLHAACAGLGGARRRAHGRRWRRPRSPRCGSRRSVGADGRCLLRRGPSAARWCEAIGKRRSSCRPLNGKLVFSAARPPSREIARRHRHNALPVGRAERRRAATPWSRWTRRLFLKGYRHVREGINPELEMGRFLTEVARYPHCVPVLGALEYMANDGQHDDARDGAELRGQPGRRLGLHARLPRTLSCEWPPPTVDMPDVPAVHGGFLALMATLGRRTAELHLRAARCAPARRPSTPSRWPPPISPASRRMRRTTPGRTLALLRERLADLPPRAQADAAQPAGARPRCAPASRRAVPPDGERHEDALPRRLPPGPGAGEATTTS